MGPSRVFFYYFSVENVPADYRVMLSPLPLGIAVLNSCFLHSDVGVHPYRIQDFHSSLTAAGILGETVSLVSFQMNHLWILTLKTAEAKGKLLAARELFVKEKNGFILNPSKTELHVKVHWIPHHVPDDNIRRALERIGQLEKNAQDVWRVVGFQGIVTATRFVRMMLNGGASLERLSHQLFGGSALVVVPGRTSVCLRCRRVGHLRKDCVVPKCESLRQFGHVKDNCVRTYASTAAGALAPPVHDLLMDKGEAEATSQTVITVTAEGAKSYPEGAPSSEPPGGQGRHPHVGRRREFWDSGSRNGA